MDRCPDRRRSHPAALAALALILAGCAGTKGPPAPEPVASLCRSIPYPPVLTRDEVAVIPPRLKRWTSGVKGALENNSCPVD